MFDVILDDLRKRFGNKIVLGTDDLEAILGISRGQQANLRSQNRFPIQTRKVGSRVVVSIYDLAKHLSGDCETEVKATMASKLPKAGETSSRKVKKAQRGLLQGNWWLFRADRIIAILENRSMLDMDSGVRPPPEDPFSGSL